MNNERRQTMAKPRKIFVFKSLLLFITFVSLTTVHLSLVIYFETVAAIFKDNYILGIVSFCLAILQFVIYFFVDNVRLNKIVDWLVAFLIVECMTLSILSTMISFSFWQIISSILTAFCIAVLFFIIAGIIKQDFTLDVVFLFLFSYIFCIGTVYFLTICVIDKVSLAAYVCLGIIAMVISLFKIAKITFLIQVISSVCSRKTYLLTAATFSLFSYEISYIQKFNVYFAQCIMGGRYAEIRLSDYILAALILYVNFFLLLLISVNFIPFVVDELQKLFK